MLNNIDHSYSPMWKHRPDFYTLLIKQLSKIKQSNLSQGKIMHGVYNLLDDIAELSGPIRFVDVYMSCISLTESMLISWFLLDHSYHIIDLLYR